MQWPARRNRCVPKAQWRSGRLKLLDLQATIVRVRKLSDKFAMSHNAGNPLVEALIGISISRLPTRHERLQKKKEKCQIEPSAYAYMA